MKTHSKENKYPVTESPTEDKNSTPGKVYLRVKQNYQTFDDENIFIFAPEWVKDALVILGPYFYNRTFDIYSADDSKKVGQFKVGNELTLLDVHKIIKSDPKNVTGRINKDKFPGIPDKVIFSMIDIVYQCIIIGRDEATKKGGYPSGNPIKTFSYSKPFYIGHCSGAQFQQDYNTGRAYLVRPPLGLLDDFIFFLENGYVKPNAIATKDMTPANGYLQSNLGEASYPFDTKSYSKHEQLAYVQYVLCTNELAKRNNEHLNLKYLKSGTGFFAEKLDFSPQKKRKAKDKEKMAETARILTEHKLKGIKAGLEYLFKNHPLDQIHSLELPFFEDAKHKPTSDLLSEIKSLCNQHGKEFKLGKRDALEPSTPHTSPSIEIEIKPAQSVQDTSPTENIPSDEKAKPLSIKLADATTDCSDSQTPAGNEFQYQSVEPMIYLALKNQGNNFSALLNSKMQVRYVPSYRLNIIDQFSFNPEDFKATEAVYPSTGSNFPEMTIRYNVELGLIFQFKNPEERGLFLSHVGQGEVPEKFRKGTPFITNPSGKTPYRHPDHESWLIIPVFINSVQKEITANLGFEPIVCQLIANMFPTSLKPESKEWGRTKQIKKTYGQTLIHYTSEQGVTLKPELEVQKNNFYIDPMATNALLPRNLGGLEGSIEIDRSGVKILQHPIIAMEKLSNIRNVKTPSIFSKFFTTSSTDEKNKTPAPDRTMSISSFPILTSTLPSQLPIEVLSSTSYSSSSSELSLVSSSSSSISSVSTSSVSVSSSSSTESPSSISSSVTESSTLTVLTTTLSPTTAPASQFTYSSPVTRRSITELSTQDTSEHSETQLSEKELTISLK